MTNRCECCGQPIPPPTPMCVCGHPMASHNDEGGRNKKAYCTLWVGEKGKPLVSWKQCPCKDATHAHQ